MYVLSVSNMGNEWPLVRHFFYASSIMCVRVFWTAAVPTARASVTH